MDPYRGGLRLVHEPPWHPIPERIYLSPTLHDVICDGSVCLMLVALIKNHWRVNSSAKRCFGRGEYYFESAALLLSVHADRFWLSTMRAYHQAEITAHVREGRFIANVISFPHCLGNSRRSFVKSFQGRQFREYLSFLSHPTDRAATKELKRKQLDPPCSHHPVNSSRHEI